MKKHLIAAAVAAAVAVPAAAQVTVYGVLDASLAKRDLNGVKTTVQGNGDYNSSSRIGFRGTEDLGGGMKASFALEGDLNINNGAGDGSTVAATGVGGLTFDRQSWVGIEGNGVGVRLGRVPDFLDSHYGYAQGVNFFDQDSGLGGKDTNTTSLTAKVGGVSLQADYSNDTGGIQTATASNGAGVSNAYKAVVGAKTTIQGFDIAVGHGSKPAGVDETMLAIRTKLGGVGVGLLYTDGKSSATVSTDYTQLLVTLPLGSGFTAHANYYSRSSQTANNEFDGYGFNIEKAFSKRTKAYVGMFDEDWGSDNTKDEQVFAVGIVHSF
jgi:predicted porin